MTPIEIEAAARRQLTQADSTDYWRSPLYDEDRALCAKVALESATADAEEIECYACGTLQSWPHSQADWGTEMSEPTKGEDIAAHFNTFLTGLYQIQLAAEIDAALEESYVRGVADGVSKAPRALEEIRAEGEPTKGEKVEDASRWFGADQDGHVMDDDELAEAIEADDLTTDFVAAARGWANAIAEAEARTWQAAADLAAEVSLCDRNGTVYAAAPMRLSIVRVLRAQAAKARAKEPDRA